MCYARNQNIRIDIIKCFGKRTENFNLISSRIFIERRLFRSSCDFERLPFLEKWKYLYVCVVPRFFPAAALVKYL